MSDYKANENRVDFLKNKAVDRDIIIHAVRGEVLLKKSPDGTPIYRKATPGECKRAALEAFDRVAFIALRMLQSGTVYERLFNEVTGQTVDGDHFEAFKLLLEEEKAKDEEANSSIREAKA